MTAMRAKMQLSSITSYGHSEQLNFNAVAAKSYPEDGSDEDNTYAKFSPQGEVRIMVANPALIGQFKVGEKYYVDFTQAPA